MSIRVAARLAIALTVSLTLSHTASAAVTWRQVTMPGGQIVLITHDPANPSRLYAGSSLGTVYLSTDAGIGWKGVKLPLASESMQWILPLPGKVVLVSAKEGLFRSTNGGTSFSAVKSYFPAGIPGVLAAANGSKVVYAADAVKGLVRSEDAGLTWKVLKAGAFSSVAVNPKNPKLVYAAAPGPVINGVSTSSVFWASTDAAASWKQYKVAGASATQIAPDPTDTATIYILGGSAPVTVSHNGGQSWTGGKFTVSDNCGPYPRGIAIDPANPKKVYMASDCGLPNGGLWLSKDAGKTWKTDNADMPLGNADGGVTIVPATANAKEVVVLGGYGGIARSTNGSNFNYVTKGINEGEANQLALDPANDAHLFVVGHWGLYRSSDSGKTLTHVDALGIDAESIKALALNPFSKGKGIYALYSPSGVTAAAALKFSKDGGATWSSHTTPLPVGQNSSDQLIFDPKQQNRLYLTGTDKDYNSVVYRSDDAGTTWDKLAISQPNYTLPLVQNPTKAGDIFVMAGAGLEHSTNAGKSFSSLLKGAATSLAVGTTLPQAIYLEKQSPNSDMSFASSTDGGKSWVAGVNPDGKKSEQYITTVLKADPGSNRVFAMSGEEYTAGGTNLYQSTDYGKSWKAVGSPGLIAGKPEYGFYWDITPTQIGVTTQDGGLMLSSLTGGPQPHDEAGR